MQETEPEHSVRQLLILPGRVGKAHKQACCTAGTGIQPCRGQMSCMAQLGSGTARFAVIGECGWALAHTPCYDALATLYLNAPDKVWTVYSEPGPGLRTVAKVACELLRHLPSKN